MHRGEGVHPSLAQPQGAGLWAAPSGLFPSLHVSFPTGSISLFVSLEKEVLTHH